MAAPLSGQDFQRLVFWAMVEQVLEFADDLVVEDHPKGAIDIVVSEPPRRLLGLLPAETRIHYFECKHHSRALELDTIAKTLVVGVRDQPMSLNIVSSSRLLPQALDYAYALFAGGDPSRTPMFKHPVFRHFSLAELISDDWSGASQRPAVASTPSLNGFTWSLAECLPFFERIVISSEMGVKRSAEVEVGSWYKLSALFPVLNVDEGIAFEPSNEHCRLVQTHRSTTIGGARLDLLLQFTAPFSSKGLGLFTLGASGVSTAAIPLVASISAVTALRGGRSDLRGDRTRDAVGRLQRRDASRLMLVEGFAGVGKSYFCEAVATQLRTQHGFDSDRFTIDGSTEGSLLHRMLVALFTPPSARSQVGAQIGAALAESLLSRANDEGAAFGEAPDAIIPLLVNGLASLGDRLLILRDCHLASEASAKWIWLLATGLDDIGWGGVRLILESRTGEPKANPHWVSLRHRLASQVKGTRVETLAPLDFAELSNALAAWFHRVDRPVLAALHRRTGGYPLLLTSHLKALADRGVIHGRDDGLWEIRASSAFLAATDLEVSAETILRDRIAQIDWTQVRQMLPDGVTPPSALGFIAVLGEEAETFLTSALGLDDRAWKAMAATIEQAEIGRIGRHATIVFAHDLMRSAAINAAAEDPAFVRLIEKVEGRAAAEPGICEALGDASLAVDRFDGARRLFNAAYELAVRREDFSGRLRIIRKLASAWTRSPPVGVAETDTMLSVLDELGWAEWTAGSLVEARQAYESIALYAERLANWDVPLREALHRSADGLRRSVGVSLELADWPAFVDAVRRVLDFGGSRTSFTSLMNRLVQACARLDLPEVGVHLARISAPLLGRDAGENASAVLLADAAHLYFSASPATAVRMLSKAHELAETPRQRAFARLDLLTAEYLTNGAIDEDRADELRSEILDNGYVTMRGRLDLLRACACLRAGRLAVARTLLDQVDLTVVLYGQAYLEPALRNAELVWAELAGEASGARQVAAQATELLEAWMKARDAVRDGLQATAGAIAREAARFAPDLEGGVEIPPLPQGSSGAIRALATNLDALRAPPASPKDQVPDETDVNWFVEVGGRRMALPPH